MKWRKKNEKINSELKWFARYMDVDYKIVKKENKNNLIYGHEKYGYDDVNVLDLFTSPYDYLYRFPLAWLTWHCLYETVDCKIDSDEFRELFPDLTKIEIKYYRNKAKGRLKESWYFLKGTGIKYKK